MTSHPVKWHYPNLFNEASSMMNLALLIYTYSELRNFARAHPQKYKGEEMILSNNEVSGKDVITFVKMNQEALTEDIDNENKVTYHYQVLSKLVAKLQGEQRGPMGALHEARVVKFDDKDADSELVHGVTVHPVARRISIVFRGSVTPSDWYKNVQVWASKHPNPFAKIEGQSKEMLIHSGFYEYLLAETDDGGRSKYQNILRTVEKLCVQYPNYTIYCSGHSLGGALATLFAFLISTEVNRNIRKPIRCITFASPLVGDASWRRAFMLAEHSNLVRHLRITVHKDIVPTIPAVSVLSRIAYKHVGVHLRLFGHGQYRLSYPKNGESDKKDVKMNTLSNTIGIGMGQRHSSMEYDRRLRVTREALSAMYIERLYDDEKLVG